MKGNVTQCRPGPTIHLIRHGETSWSLTGQHTGRSDPPLTEQGEQQARLLAGQLGAMDFSHVFTSPRLRARRTCELCGLYPPAKIEPDLAEWDYGDYEGLRTADIRVARPDWNLFRDGCPGGESAADISRRADRVIAQLLRLQGDVAVFTHGHFGRVCGARWIDLSAAHGQHLLLDTASICMLGFEHGVVKAPAIVVWNSGARPVEAPNSSRIDGHVGSSERRALQRWENEGGISAALPSAPPALPDTFAQFRSALANRIAGTFVSRSPVHSTPQCLAQTICIKSVQHQSARIDERTRE